FVETGGAVVSGEGRYATGDGVAATVPGDRHSTGGACAELTGIRCGDESAGVGKGGCEPADLDGVLAGGGCVEGADDGPREYGGVGARGKVARGAGKGGGGGGHADGGRDADAGSRGTAGGGGGV